MHTMVYNVGSLINIILENFVPSAHWLAWNELHWRWKNNSSHLATTLHFIDNIDRESGSVAIAARAGAKAMSLLPTIYAVLKSISSPMWFNLRLNFFINVHTLTVFILLCYLCKWGRVSWDGVEFEGGGSNLVLTLILYKGWVFYKIYIFSTVYYVCVRDAFCLRKLMDWPVFFCIILRVYIHQRVCGCDIWMMHVRKIEKFDLQVERQRNPRRVSLRYDS